MDFIYELYKNENFTTYLIIILAVLVVLFIVVLIFGKKDQKLEETKRLEKIDTDAFKEKQEEPVKIEAPVKEELKDQTELVVEETETKEDVHVTEFEPENKALLNEEESVIAFDEEGLEKDLQEIENIKKEFSNIELPKVEDNEKQPVSKSNQEVFSSVYTNSEELKEEVKQERNTYIDDDGEEIELPTLK